jgi:hypothetical protein
MASSLISSTPPLTSLPQTDRNDTPSSSAHLHNSIFSPSEDTSINDASSRFSKRTINSTTRPPLLQHPPEHEVINSTFERRSNTQNFCFPPPLRWLDTLFNRSHAIDQEEENTSPQPQTISLPVHNKMQEDIKYLNIEQLNMLKSEAKATITSLDLNGEITPYFNFSEFIGLEELNLSNCVGLTSEQFNTISSEAKASIETLYLDSLCVENFDFSEFTGLKELHLSYTQGLTSHQFNTLSTKTKASLEFLFLEQVNLEQFDFTELTKLRVLRLSKSQNFTFPETLARFENLEKLDLSNIPTIITIPEEILYLSSYCTVDIEGCRLSELSLENIQLKTSQEGYSGPHFFFSIIDTSSLNTALSIDELLDELYVLSEKPFSPLEQIQRDNSNLQIWLSRLKDIAGLEKGNINQKKIATTILESLELANRNPEFLETLLSIIDEAAVTCGDRMSLSVLNLNIAYKIQSANLSDLKSLANLLSRGVWAIKLLEDIARQKVKTLPLVDELEVYLAYPTMLREKLQLPIPIEEMLHFAYSEVTQADLNEAYEVVNKSLENKSLLSNFLISEDKWIEALEHNFSDKIRDLKNLKDSDVEKAIEPKEYIAIETSYKKELNKITIKALFE